MENNIIIRQCDLMKENNYYKWYDVSHIKEFTGFLFLVYSKETKIAHLVHVNSSIFSFSVNNDGTLNGITLTIS